MVGSRKLCAEGGFTYLTALFLVAILGTMLAATAQIASRANQREREAELIWIGSQFQQAIGLYYQRTPGAIKRFPEKLEDLLEDKRYATRQRYLRRIYLDPMTRSKDWDLIMAPMGGIMGVRSRSTEKSIKQRTISPVSPVSPESRGIPSADVYSNWQFVYSIPELAAPALPRQ